MNKAKVIMLETLYAGLPQIACKRLCTRYCGFVPMTNIEAKRIEKRTHERPSRTPTGACAFLEMGACTIYELRPMICRLFGLVNSDLMRCPHGCVPSRWLTDAEGKQLLAQVLRLSPTAKR